MILAPFSKSEVYLKIMHNENNKKKAIPKSQGIGFWGNFTVIGIFTILHRIPFTYDSLLQCHLKDYPKWLLQLVLQRYYLPNLYDSRPNYLVQ